MPAYKGLFERLGRGRKADIARPPDPRAPMMIYLSWARAFWRVWTHTVLAAVDTGTQPDLARAYSILLASSGLPAVLNRVAAHNVQLVNRYMHNVQTAVVKQSLHTDALPPVSPRLQSQVDDWRVTNLKLIKGVGDDQVQRLNVIFKPAQEAGIPHKQLVSQVKEALNIGENRAKLIARDQTTKFNSSLQQVSQQDAGITEFIWSTSHDGDVRPSHKLLEGKTFAWANPPVVDGEQAVPGQPINCRCQAIPKISLFANLDTPVARVARVNEAEAAIPAIDDLGLVNAQYIRGGMRPASLDYARAQFEGMSAVEAQEYATTAIAPVRIEVYPAQGGDQISLNDGRHRMTAAREAGATHIRATITKYGKRGAVRSTTTGIVKIGTPDGKSKGF